MQQDRWEKVAEFLGYKTEEEMWKDLYLEQKISVDKLAKRLDLGRATILKRMKKYGIALRDRGGLNNQYSQRRILYRLDQRIVLSLSAEKLSSLCHISTQACRRYQILVRGRRDKLDNAICSDQSNERLEAVFESFEIPPAFAPGGES